MKFPHHEASLHLTHNDHKSVYETAEQWIADNDERGFAEWISEEQKQKAIETDSIWTLQWYPNTPVGFNCLAAADLDLLLEAASAGE